MKIKKFELKTSPEVEAVFEAYPDGVKDKMQTLRNLVIETAREDDGISVLDETLKWGEPSYVTKKGSTLRMDWKAKTPDHYQLYFQCSSRLVETFRLVYDHVFHFEGNRAIVFPLDQKLPIDAVKKCISTTLNYHTVKEDKLLGL